MPYLVIFPIQKTNRTSKTIFFSNEQYINEYKNNAVKCMKCTNEIHQTLSVASYIVKGCKFEIGLI